MASNNAELHKCYMGPHVKIAVVVAIVVVLLCAVIPGFYLIHKKNEIQKHDRAFAQLALGDSAEKVFDVMGSPDQVRMSENLLLFPNASQDTWHVSAPGNIQPTVQFCYTVPTFYLPITWVMSFDQNMTLVSKMRLD